jgi:sulfur-oxidizing protein SoxX
VKGIAAAVVGLAALSGAAGIAFAQATANASAPNGEGVTADGMRSSLRGVKGDASRGREIVANRQLGLCLLCHSGPFEEERLQGNLAPDLRGAGSRSSEAALRLRIVDSSRINPGSIMPAYYRTEALVRVAAAYQGKPVLSAQQIEDVVAFLISLRD